MARPPGRGRLIRILIHLSMLGVSQVGVTAAAFGAQILLARTVSPAAFGTFTAALALMSLVAPLVVFGVSELWLQRFGQEGAAAHRWVRPALRLVTACCAVAVAAVLAWSVVDRADVTSALVRGLFAVVLAAQVGLTLVASVQQLRGDYAALSALQVAPHLARLLVVLAAWAAGVSVLAVAVGYAAVAALTLAACLVGLRPFVRGTMPLDGHPRPASCQQAPAPVGVGRVARAGTPFMLGNVFYLIGMYLGTVVVAEVLGPEAAAVLAVPMSVLAAVYLVPKIVYQQYFLAKLHRWSSGDRDAVLLAYRFGTPGMTVLGVAVAFVVAACAPVLPVLLGRGYGTAASVLTVLALAVPFRFGAAAAAALLTSGGLLRRKVVLQGLGALVFLVALAVATPAWGVRGAAGATVVAEAVLCLLFWVTVRRRVVAGATLPTWHDLRRRLARGSA